MLSSSCRRRQLRDAAIGDGFAMGPILGASPKAQMLTANRYWQTVSGMHLVVAIGVGLMLGGLVFWAIRKIGE